MESSSDSLRNKISWFGVLIFLTAKFNLGELYNRVGFAKEIISKGRFAEIDADQRPFRYKIAILLWLMLYSFPFWGCSIPAFLLSPPHCSITSRLLEALRKSRVGAHYLEIEKEKRDKSRIGSTIRKLCHLKGIEDKNSVFVSDILWDQREVPLSFQW